jgi:hypothetical protein
VSQKLNILQLNWFYQLADVFMMPFMYCLAGTLEKPQQTHFWNNTKLKPQDVAHLDPHRMVHCQGVVNASTRKILGIPVFHIPILGGWRNYIVLEPSEICGNGWHVGWVAHDVVGVSRIKLINHVRLLLGPGDVSFFGVSPDGEQITVQQTGEGKIGDHGPYSKATLL